MKRQGNHIRVFISGTFRDMKHEFDHLTKVIFPEVRQLARERGVHFTPIDLRWGITEDNKGEVISTCLEAIDSCKPFFMGFLGERYGWSPTRDDVPSYERLIERFSVIESSLEASLSVTEMEMLHGVLEHEGEVHASFYQRDLALTERLAEGHDQADYIEESEAGRTKLKSLKQRIEESGHPISHYKSVEAMGQQVKAYLIARLDELSESEVPDPVEADRRKHRAYSEELASLCSPHQESVQVLNDFMSRVHAQGQTSRPLLITGPPGRGKSALISSWVTGLKAALPDLWVIEHYAGVKNGDDAVSVFNRVITELKEVLTPEDSDQPTSDSTDPSKTLSYWLGRVPPDRPLLLVLDAINQISSPSLEAGPNQISSPDLRWIPTSLPPNVACVMSATPPSEQEHWLKQRGAELYEVPMLDLEARGVVTEKYLAHYQKKLTDVQFNRITNAHSCESPLFLTTVLAELVIFGDFEKFDDHLNRLVTSKDLGELFKRVITRFEEDYGDNLTRSVLTALWASQTGLSIDELVEITGFKLVEILRVIFPLHQHLRESDGLIQYSRSALGEAVRDRYLSEQEDQQRRHRELAAWFRDKSSGARRAHMLNFHSYYAEDWPQLHSDLVDHTLGVEALLHVSHVNLCQSWTEIRKHLNVSMDDEYQRVWQDEGKHWREPQVEDAILSLLSFDGHAAELQVILRKRHVEHRRADVEAASTLENHRNLIISLSALGDLLLQRRDLRNADLAYQEVLSHSRGLVSKYGTPESRDDLRTSLSKVGDLFRERGESYKALEIYQEALEISRELVSQRGEPRDRRNLSSSLNCVGDMLSVIGEHEQASSDYQEGLKIARELNTLHFTAESRRDLSISLGKMSDIYKARGDFKEALDASQEKLKISRGLVEELETPDRLRDFSVALYQIGSILESDESLDEAFKTYQEGLHIDRDLLKYLETPQSLSDLSISLNAIGRVSLAIGKLDEALAAYQEDLELKRTHHKQPGTPDSLRHCFHPLRKLAHVQHLLGAHAESQALIAQALETHEIVVAELDDKSRRDLFFTAALILEQSGDLTEAQSFIEQALVYSTAWLENQNTPGHQATHHEIETASARISVACSG